MVRNKDFPNKVTIRLHRLEFQALLAWLHAAGHELRVTMKFGDNQHKSADPDHLQQDILFKDRKDAMLFKLAWYR